MNKSEIKILVIFFTVTALFGCKQRLPEAKKPSEFAAICNQKNKVIYDEMIASKRYWDASLEIFKCSKDPLLPEFAEMRKRAEVLHYTEIAENKNKNIEERSRAMERLIIDYPGEGEKYKEQFKKFVVQKMEKQNRELVAKNKSKGVSIGMTKSDVYNSSWGKPSSVNTTITADVRHE